MIRVGKDGLGAESFPWIRARKRPVTISVCELWDDAEVETPEGVMTAKKGDFLMRGVMDELYLCRKDIFAKSFDLVESRKRS